MSIEAMNLNVINQNSLNLANTSPIGEIGAHLNKVNSEYKALFSTGLNSTNNDVKKRALASITENVNPNMAAGIGSITQTYDYIFKVTNLGMQMNLAHSTAKSLVDSTKTLLTNQ